MTKDTNTPRIQLPPEALQRSCVPVPRKIHKNAILFLLSQALLNQRISSAMGFHQEDRIDSPVHWALQLLLGEQLAYLPDSTQDRVYNLVFELSRTDTEFAAVDFHKLSKKAYKKILQVINESVAPNCQS